jgi:RNA polymerase-interacting CarD/CdnL/TRCF family regulator
MSNTETTDPIGRKILSIDLGIGVISGIEKLQEGGDDYYVVEYGNKNAKTYFPMSENKKIRFISSENDFLKSVKKLKSEKIVKEFKSKKERQSYFNSIHGDSNLTQIISRILEINSLDDMVLHEKDKLAKLVGIIQAEASAIYDISESEGVTFISDYLIKK